MEHGVVLAAAVNKPGMTPESTSRVNAAYLLRSRVRDSPLQHAVGYARSSVQELSQTNFIEVFNFKPIPSQTLLVPLPRSRQQIRNNFTTTLL